MEDTKARRRRRDWKARRRSEEQRRREGPLDKVVARIVEAADPDEIILFGSAARGKPGPHSDLDLLVVKPGVHRRQLAQRIYRNLLGVGHPVDVIVATPDDLEQYRNCPALVIHPALQEGRTVYRA